MLGILGVRFMLWFTCCFVFVVITLVDLQFVVAYLVYLGLWVLCASFGADVFGGVLDCWL